MPNGASFSAILSTSLAPLVLLSSTMLPPIEGTSLGKSPSLRPEGAVGVYLTAESIARRDGFLDQTLTHVKNAGGNAIVIDVKEHGVFFESNAILAHAFGTLSPRYDLSEVVKEAKERGIYVIARFVATKDKRLARARPETQIIHPKTQRSVGSLWVDPGNPTMRAYNRELLEEIVAAGVDEINIDYIRYPTEYHSDLVGRTVEEKMERVASFVQMAREMIDASGKDVKLGISTYAILGWEYDINQERLGQDVVRLAPLVDIISPMAYPASFAPGHYYTGETGRSRMYELVYKTLVGYREFLSKEDALKLRPWIQGNGASSFDIQEEIDAVFDAGACGFTIWSPGNRYESFYAGSEKVSPPRCLSQVTPLS